MKSKVIFIRISEEIHDEILANARKENLSLNAYCLKVLAPDIPSHASSASTALKSASTVLNEEVEPNRSIRETMGRPENNIPHSTCSVCGREDECRITENDLGDEVEVCLSCVRGSFGGRVYEKAWARMKRKKL